MKHIEDIVFENKAFPIKIARERYSVIDNPEKSTSAFHEAVEIKYFYEGEATLLIGSEAVTARAGDIIVINPYEFHTTIAESEECKSRYHLFMIGLDFFEGCGGININLRRLFLEKGIRIKQKISDSKEAASILTSMADASLRSDEYSKLNLFGLTAELFSQLLSNYSKEPGVQDRECIFNHYATIEPAIIMIRDRYSEDISIDALADSCRISKYHFCRIFKSVMGMSAIKYLNTHRLKIADTLLKNTNKPILKVCEMCGFSDASYFCKVYKSFFGKTPANSKR